MKLLKQHPFSLRYTLRNQRPQPASLRNSPRGFQPSSLSGFTQESPRSVSAPRIWARSEKEEDLARFFRTAQGLENDFLYSRRI